MRIFRLAVPVVLTLSLSACSGTWQGVRTDARELKTSVSAENMPGYRPNPSRLVVKPRPQPPASTVEWNDLGELNGWRGDGAVSVSDIGDDLAPITGNELPVLSPPPVVAVPPRGFSYNADVSVFPIDGDGDVITDALPTPFRSDNYGIAAEKPLYFAHGSAKVKTADKKRLRKLAKKTKKKHRGEVAVSVIGHASRRVDRVKDPIKKKMVNFRMAQKRANAVTHELKAAGLKPAWVQAVSKGDDEPNPFPPPGMDQEAADRRVEVYMDEERP